jgi:hypothetical protein
VVKGALVRSFPFCLLAVASCFLLPPGARPPAHSEAKDALLKSALFRSLGAFYGRRDTIGSHPTFSRGEVKALQAIMQGAADTVQSDQARLQIFLDSVFGVHLVRPSAKVRVATTWVPEARSPAPGALTIDARVIHAAFRAAAVSGWRDSGTFDSFRHANASVWLSDTTEQAIVTTLRSMRVAVEEMRGGGATVTMIREIGGDLDSDDLPINNPQLRRIRQRYSAALLFLVGHEMGHIAMGHNDLDLSSLDCPQRKQLELLADRYAALVAIFARVPLGLQAFGFGDDQRETAAMIGDQAFLGIAYDFAGFGSDACAYPTAVERARATRIVYDAVTDLFRDPFSRPTDIWSVARILRATPYK